MLRRCDFWVRISFGAVLLWGWFALVNGWRLTGVILLAASIHEMGHLLMLYLTGAKVSGLSIGVFGAVLDADTSRLSYGRELASVLAGPAANLMAAVVCGTWGNNSFFIGANVILCGFNLLPIRPLDGGRSLYLLALWKWGVERGERLTGRIGSVTALLLAAALTVVMYRSGGSLWLLPPAGWMLGAAVREFRENDEIFLLFL